MSTTDPILAVIREAVRLLSDGVIVTTADLEQPRIVLVNEALCRITGYRAEELIGNTPRLLQGPARTAAIIRSSCRSCR
jgi:PAS domain S-box-containing protein